MLKALSRVSVILKIICFSLILPLIWNILLGSPRTYNKEHSHPTKHSDSLYEKIHLSNYHLKKELFTLAYHHYSLASSRKKSILGIIDYNLPSTDKRFWIIDFDKNIVLTHTYVAHGKNTGDNYAYNFSNIEGSKKTCLGKFITGNTYQGEHGLSLELHGQEKNINDKAYKRRIVMHGAHYVNTSFLINHSRLGRSWGCPAISMDEVEKIIPILAGGSFLFLYHKSYPENSTH